MLTWIHCRKERGKSFITAIFVFEINDLFFIKREKLEEENKTRRSNDV